MRTTTVRRLTAFATVALLMLPALTNAADPPPPRQPGVPTLWLVGDSTVHNGTKGEVGWGEPLAQMFDPARVRVVNRAIGGRSSRTYMNEGRWDAVVAELRKGDVVLIQFGHNDGGPLVDAKDSKAVRDRGSIRGIGEESKDVVRNDGKAETVHTFGWYLRKYVADARAKGATPVICSWVPHCPKAGEAIEADPKPSGYREHAAAVAAAAKCDYIDLYGLVWAQYAKLTPEQVKADYFTPIDNTHTSAAGAKVNAAAVVEGLRKLPDVAVVGGLRPTTQP